MHPLLPSLVAALLYGGASLYHGLHIVRRAQPSKPVLLGVGAFALLGDQLGRHIQLDFQKEVPRLVQERRQVGRLQQADRVGGRVECAARALLGIDQRRLAELAGVSLPTIQRMEASPGNVRGVVESLTRVLTALDAAGVEVIGENAPSVGTGRGVRLKAPAQ